MERSILLLDEVNGRLYRELEEKQYDRRSQYVVAKWIPCASRIRELTTGINAYIDKLRSETRTLTQSQEAALLDTVARYKKEILVAFDPMIPYRGDYLKKDIADFDKHLPLNKDTAFLDNNPEISRILLNDLQSDVYISEYSLLSYCTKQTAVIDESIDIFNCIISQSSSYVKGGDPIKIEAGVGAFSLQSNPQIRIGKQWIKVNTDEGTASTTFKAEARPGKHVVAVVIKYTKPDGSTAELTKKLEYTVAAQ